MSTDTLPAQADTGNSVIRAPAPARRQRPRRAPRPVTGARPLAAILADVESYLTDYVTFPSAHEAPGITLQMARDYVFHDAAASQLFTLVSAPAHNSGKSTLLQTIAYALPKGAKLWVASTGAPIYETINADHPSILLDRIGSMVKPGSNIGDLLDAANSMGWVVPRQRQSDDGNYTAEFDLFTPIWMAGINAARTLPVDLLSRCLIINLHKAPAIKRMGRNERDQQRKAGAKLRAELNAALLPQTAYLAEQTPDLTPVLESDSRVAEGLFLPVAIADLAGNGWAERARESYSALVRPYADKSLAVNEILLRDSVAVTLGEDRVSTMALIAKLIALDDAPWAEKWEFRYSTVNGSARACAMELTRMLGDFGLHSDQMRIGTQKTRGYITADIAAAWNRQR